VRPQAAWVASDAPKRRDDQESFKTEPSLEREGGLA
jgi:hypothetical protein